MTSELLNFLIDKYKSLPYKGASTALKWYYQFQTVHVNLFFDAYDFYCPVFYLVLYAEKVYYYSSLNLGNTKTNTQYLYNLPDNIKAKIKDKEGTLQSFYDRMENALLKEKYIVINCEKDNYYKQIKYSANNRDDLPYFHYLRSMRMSDRTFNNIRNTMNIDDSVLKKIMDAGFTIVRTGEIEERSDFFLALKGKKLLNNLS